MPTGTQLAQRMIERAVRAAAPFSWVAGDEVNGQNPGLRAALEAERVSYVMAVPCSEPVTVPAGQRRAGKGPGERVTAAVVRGWLQGAAAV